MDDEETMPKSHYETLTLYYVPESGPCRTVLLAARVIGIELNLKLLDLYEGEHYSKQFLRINPQHNVPTLCDNGFVLTESRAIIAYLQDKYGKRESLYPKDAKERALVNQRLFFDIGTLYGPIVGCYAKAYYGSKSFDETFMPKIEQAFAFLDTFLEGEEFVAGKKLTLADIAIVSTVATAEAVLDFPLGKYSNVERWFGKLKSTLPDYDGTVTQNMKKLRARIDHHLKTGENLAETILKKINK